MIKKKIGYFQQTPKIYCSIDCGGASIIRQTYDVVSGEYYPNRALFPLILTPVISCKNPDGSVLIENALPYLTDGHWYRFDNTTTAQSQFTSATEIKNGTKVNGQNGNYTIDTAVGSPTYGRLSSGENVSPSNPVTYLFTATLTIDQTSYKVSSSFSLDSVTLSVNPELNFDNNSQAMYNPCDKDTPRYFMINPEISPKGLTASFRWECLLDNQWIAIDEDLRTWAVSKNGEGIKIDRSIMPSSLTLKCVAKVNIGDNTTEIEKIVTHIRRLPYFETEINQVADINYGTYEINPRALIQTGKGVIDDPAEEVSINWYGTGDTLIATGINPRVYIHQLGEEMNLGLEVTDNGGYKAFMDDDGEYLCDDDQSLIIVK